MTQSVRDQLEALNRECEAFCRDESNWSDKWRGADDKGNPNFLLAFSSVETFERPGGVMILGTNPGGDHTRAKEHPVETPFECPGWSSYLDDDWGNGSPGSHMTQRAVRKIAEVVAGESGDGAELLRTSPTGNLIPFRSKKPSHLQRVASNDKKPYDFGIDVGWQLIRIARPRVLILLASDRERWAWLLDRINGQSNRQWCKNLPGSNRTFREAVVSGSRPRPEFIWALPRVNTGTAGQRPRDELRKRLRKYGIRWTRSGIRVVTD